MKLVTKLIGFILMIVSPIISWKAFYEYFLVKYLAYKPSYPFGKKLMHTIQTNDLHYLANYQSELLTIGIVFLSVSVLVWVSSFIKALINLIWIGLIAVVVFYFYSVLK